MGSPFPPESAPWRPSGAGYSEDLFGVFVAVAVMLIHLLRRTATRPFHNDRGTPSALASFFILFFSIASLTEVVLVGQGALDLITGTSRPIEHTLLLLARDLGVLVGSIFGFFGCVLVGAEEDDAAQVHFREQRQKAA